MVWKVIILVIKVPFKVDNKIIYHKHIIESILSFKVPQYVVFPVKYCAEYIPIVYLTEPEYYVYYIL